MYPDPDLHYKEMRIRNPGFGICICFASKLFCVQGGRNAWNNWIPLENMRGQIVHKW
jgi:hypothetical protein